MAPRVSVLITSFQRCRYLRECVQSIISSSFADIELIIVDDASTDGSFELARELQLLDSRIRVYRNERNLGQCGNRNLAASLAAGEFLKYVDSDDVIYPHTIEVMVGAMSRNERIGLALSHSEAELSEPYPRILTPEECYRMHFLGRGALSCGPSAAIIRRKAFEAVRGFQPTYGVVLDIDLWIRLAARWETALLPPGLVWWRRHGGQAFTGGNSEMEYLILGHQMSLHALQASDSPLKGSDGSAAVEKVNQHHARRLLALALKRGKLKAAWQAFRASNLTVWELLQGLGGYR